MIRLVIVNAGIGDKPGGEEGGVGAAGEGEGQAAREVSRECNVGGKRSLCDEARRIEAGGGDTPGKGSKINAEGHRWAWVEWVARAGRRERALGLSWVGCLKAGGSRRVAQDGVRAL